MICRLSRSNIEVSSMAMEFHLLSSQLGYYTVSLETLTLHEKK